MIPVIAMKKYFLSTLLFLCLIGTVPAKTQVKTTAHPIYVIVHGAWGGSWAFRKTDSLLTAKGCKVYRPSLTGQGERVHLASPENSLSTHINDVVNTLLFEDLHNVVPVGHSYGGMVVTGVADRVPDRIQKVIYLDAFVPKDGESVKDIRAKDWEQYEKMIQNGFLVPDWLNPEKKIPGDVPQSLKTFTEPIVLKDKRALLIPGVYILTVEKDKKPEDDSFTSQAAKARQKNWTVVQMEADHNPQWSATEKLADLLFENR
jgi:pimeloyl-ACP methyl ester carboxylesterase